MNAIRNVEDDCFLCILNIFTGDARVLQHINIVQEQYFFTVKKFEQPWQIHSRKVWAVLRWAMKSSSISTFSGCLMGRNGICTVRTWERMNKNFWRYFVTVVVTWNAMYCRFFQSDFPSVFAFCWSRRYAIAMDSTCKRATSIRFWTGRRCKRTTWRWHSKRPVSFYKISRKQVVSECIPLIDWLIDLFGR